MALINEQPVNAKLLKGYDIIFPALVVQLIQLLLNGFFRLFKLLNREIFSSVSLQFSNADCDFIKLLLQDCPLSFNRHRDFLKLRMTDNYCVIISGSDSTTELLTIFCFKIFLRSHKDIRRRIKLQVFRRPLLRQVIWNNEQRFIAQSESFRLLRRRNHFKGFARPYCVSEKCIAAVKNVGNGIFLMFPKFNFRVHSIKGNVASVILTRSDTVKLLIVNPAQSFSAGRIRPYPLLKCSLNKFLLGLSDGSFLFIEDCLLLAFIIFNIIKDTDIFQVQRFLNNLVSVYSACAVGVVRFDISSVIGLALDVPLARIRREVNFDIPLCIAWRFKQIKHKILHIVRRKPSSAEPHRYFTRRQVFRLYSFQRFHIDLIILRVKLR